MKDPNKQDKFSISLKLAMQKAYNTGLDSSEAVRIAKQLYDEAQRADCQTPHKK
jgi:hypothetical protein